MENEKKDVRYVGVKENLIFGIANGGQCFGNNMFTGTFLSMFFVRAFGLPYGAITTMILVLGVWDVFNDPIMGSIVDRTHTRYGKLRPYLLFVPIPLAITTVLFWSGPIITQGIKSQALKLVYVYVLYLLWELFYTIGDIPFWGMSAAMSPTPSDRTRAITTARFLSGLIGGISTAVMLPVLTDLSETGKIPLDLKTVYALCGVVAAIMVVGLFSLSGLFVKERVVQEVDTTSFLDCFKYMLKNKQLLLIVLSNVLSIFSAIAGVFSGYYYIEVLNMMSWNTVVSIIGGIGGAVGMATITLVKKRFDNCQIMIINNIVRAVTGAIAFFIGFRHYDAWQYVIPAVIGQNVVSGVFMGYNSVASTEVIADCVDYMEWKTGVRNEGMAFATLTFMGKLTGRVSTAIGTALLPVIGYFVTNIQNADGTTTQVTECTEAFGKPTEFWLWAFFTIIPNVLALLSNIPLHFYTLRGEKLQKIRADMDERRHVIAQKMMTSEVAENG